MESTKELADVLYREEVARARAMPEEAKLMEGLKLFERAFHLMMDGLRQQHPDLDDAAVLALLNARLERLDRLDRT